MNQEKIGKFISFLRKEKDMTQQELARKLNISDRTVSKWENGRGLPDLGIIKPLCEELDISINEFFSGEKLNKKEYNDKLEENIEKTIEYSNNKIKSITGKIRVFLIVILTIIVIVLIDTFQAIIFKNSPLIGFRDDYLMDVDSYVDRGILVNTYYCTHEKDIVNVRVLFKSTKFDCPVDNNNVCPRYPSIVPTMDFEEAEFMSMTIKEGTLSNSGATFIIKDIGEDKSVFGGDYRIDVFDVEWKTVNTIIDNYGWTSIGYQVGNDGLFEMNVNWSWLYGELPKGHYRIVKSVSENEYFSCEFDIE